MFFKKKIQEVELPKTKPVEQKLKTVDSVLARATKDFKEISDENARIVDSQNRIIEQARSIKIAAYNEKSQADTLIENFCALTKKVDDTQ